MSEPTDFERAEQLLPGLEPVTRPTSRLELATRRTIAALAEAGQLSEASAMLCQLMLDLAEVVDVGRRHGRASAAAMAAAQLQAAYALIVPQAEGGGEGDEFDRLAGDLRCGAGLCNHPDHPALV